MLAFTAGIGVGAVEWAGDSDDAGPTTAAPSEAVQENAEPTEAPSQPEPEPSYYEPTVDDYALTIKPLEKKCFGSAGCNVRFRIEVTSLYSGEVDPTVTYELTFEIQGGEDTLINTIELEGDQYTVEEELVSIPTEDTELVAVITDVVNRGF